MPKKRITFILIPSNNGQVREYRFGSWVPWVGALCCLTLFAAATYYGFGYHQRQDQQETIERLKLEKDHLKEMFDLTQLRVNQLDQDMEELVTTDERLRNLHGMELLSAEERQLGVGGPEILPDMELISPREFKHLEQLSVRIERMLRETRQQAESYDQIMRRFLASGDSLRHIPTVYPVPMASVWKSSDFAERIDPFTGRRAFHTGIDFAGKTGTPIYATADGVVTHAYRHNRLGKVIVIEHDIEGVDDEGVAYQKEGIYRTEYGHLDKILVGKGEKVTRHQKIGLMGNTGRSTGPHLHYAVRYQDRSRGGKYKGYVDPLDYILNSDPRDASAAGWLGTEE